MGRIEILNKLKDELEKGIETEAQVVYILSRIRKYLELRNFPGQYKQLNFYSNWALHTKIDRTEPVRDVLLEFLNQPLEARFLRFTHFHQELKKFLVDHNLPTKIVDDQKSFNDFRKILIKIYSDTPLEVYIGKKIITLSKTEITSENADFEVAFKIEEFPDD